MKKGVLSIACPHCMVPPGEYCRDWSTKAKGSIIVEIHTKRYVQLRIIQLWANYFDQRQKLTNWIREHGDILT